MTSLNENSLDDIAIWKSILSDYEKICLLIGYKFGIFDEIQSSSSNSVSSNEIIEKFRLRKYAGQSLLYVLASLNYLSVDNEGKYGLTPLSRRYLISDSANTFKNLLNYYEIDEKILKAVKQSSEPENPNEWQVFSQWQAGQVDEKEAANFSSLMQSISLDAAIHLGKTLKLKEEFNVTSILDVAGGSGCYSIAFATEQQSSNIKAVLLDLGEVCKVAQGYIEKSKAPAGSVLTYVSDMFREPLPSHDHPTYGYQAIFLSQILHDWDENENKFLLKKSFDALPSGGSIFIHEAVLNERGDGPLEIALYSFDMAVIGKGKQYKFSELKEMLESAGFVNILMRKAFGIYSLVSALKA